MPATANGKSVLSAVIREPRVGVWTAELEADSDVALTGQLTLEIDGERWVGTVERGDVASGRAHALVFGGAGKLGTVVDAKYYLNATFDTVLADIMTSTGETLASSTVQRVRQQRAPRWARSMAAAGQAVRQIADETACTWRVLRDGTVWLGDETWPDAKVVYETIDVSPSHGSVLIAPEQPLLAPGQTFWKQHVSMVTTRLTGRGELRQEALFEDGESAEGRLLRDVAAVVESLVGNRIDYSRLYPSKVIKQSSDGTLELLPDNRKVRGTGISQVQIRHGLPGVTVKVPDGGHVLLFFEDGDPKKPAAALWPDGSSVTEITIASPKVTIDGDLFVTGEVTAQSKLPATAVTLSKHKHLTAMGPSDKPTVPEV